MNCEEGLLCPITEELALEESPKFIRPIQSKFAATTEERFEVLEGSRFVGKWRAKLVVADSNGAEFAKEITIYFNFFCEYVC